MKTSIRRLSVLLLLCAGCMMPSTANDATRWTIEVASAGEKPSGPFRILDDQNRVMLEGSLVDGQMDGSWTAWSSQRERLVILNYRAGVREGTVTMWYGSFAFPEAAGRLKLEGNFLHGSYDGKVTRYHPSGQRRSTRTYVQGEIKQSQCWAPDGTEQTPSFAAEVAAEEHKGDMLYLSEIEGMVPRALAQAHRRLQ